MTCAFVPPYLLDRLAAHPDADAARCGERTRAIDREIRRRRASARPGALPATGVAWLVHDAGNGSGLPGELVRSAGEPEVDDVAVNEAATGIEQTLALLSDLGRSSYDDKGATVLATVHYEENYDNAFWDGRQLVFGDGDGKVFDRFTKPIDVLGHELAHALTEHSAGLVYRGQPGALNESVSDVIGACVKQRLLGQEAAEADWLIGEGIFLPGVNGRALRSMSRPGTAYDDPVIGKDPQVASMSDYVITSDDNGGVHLNSGIPNKAFHLAATAIGGTAWEGAGRIWYSALTSGIRADTDFAGFADVCVHAAGEHAEVVRLAWDAVGVPGARSAPPSPAGSAGTLTVRQSGGFTGMVREATIELESDDPRVREARELLARVDLATVRPGTPRPDRFVYVFACPPTTATVQEPDLTPELARLVELVLG